MTGTRTCETGKLYEVCQRQTKQKQKGALACARTRIPRQKITSKVFFFIMLLGSGSGDGQMHLNIYICYGTPNTQLRVPSDIRPPLAPRPCHARPTRQPSVSPTKYLQPCPTRRAGGVERRPPGDGSLTPRGGGE